MCFFFIFLRELINPCFCDLKDIESDKKENLKTFPIVFGKKKVVRILSGINVISGIPIIIGVYLGLLPKFALILFLILFYTVYYFSRINKKEGDSEGDSEFLYSVLPDLEFILYAPLILVSRLL